MEADEVMEWQVWLNLEPRGELRADYRSAQITHAVYTILQSFSKSTTRISLEDNLLKFTAEKTIEEQGKQNALAMMSLFGGEYTSEMDKLAKDVKDTFVKEDNDSELRVIE
jgi:hypothetical protein